MKFLVDESVEFPVVTFLRSLGHDVVAVTEDLPARRDTEVLEVAYRQQRVLITNDKDFGELIFLRGFSHCGVVLFRLPQEDASSKISRLRYLLEKYGNKLSENFVVIQSDAVRIRSKRWQT